MSTQATNPNQKATDKRKRKRRKRGQLKYTPLMARVHWLIFRVVLLVLLAAPRWTVRRGFAVAGAIGTHFVPRYVRICRENLRRAFPHRFRPGFGSDPDGDDSDPKLEEFIRLTWANVFLSFGEGLFGPRLMHVAGWQRNFHVLLTPKARQTFAERRGNPPGVLFCTGHMGPWEMSIHPAAIAGFPMSVIGRPLDSPLIDEEITAMRSRFGNTALSKFKSLTQQVRDVRAGKALGLVIDQDPGTKARGTFVKFFGRWCKTLEAPAVLAIRYGAPLIPSFTVRVGMLESSYIVLFYDPVDVAGLDYRNPVDLQLVMQRWHNCLEDLIRRYPEQYYWLHYKWRTRPPGEPGVPHRHGDRQPDAEAKAKLLGYYGGDAGSGDQFWSGKSADEVVLADDSPDRSRA